MSKLYKLNQLYEISSGISTTPEQYGKGYPFLSFKTIFNNSFLPDVLPELLDTTEKEQEIYSIKKGDVFLTRTSETLDELAMSSVATKDYPKATFSGFAKRLRPISNLTDEKFMGFFLRSNYFRKIIDSNATMTLRASFNETIFSYINVYLPDIIEQNKIGNLLYKFEEKIKLNNKINEELEQMAKLLFDYWFVQFDFPDKNGKPYKSSGGKMTYNPQLKREIPDGWEVTALENFFTFEKGKIPNFISTIQDNIHSMPYLTIEALENIPTEFCENIPSALVNNDILMVMDGASSSKVFIGIKGIIGSTLAKLAIKNDFISMQFLYLLLKKYESIFKIVNTGSTIPHANKNYINKFLIPYHKELIIKFNEIIIPMINTIIKNKEENQQLAELRDWLLPMLMNGQVKIKG